MDSDDEFDLLAASRRADQQGGNRPFSVNMECIGPMPRWRHGVAVKHAVRSRNELGHIEDLSMSMAVHHSTGTRTWTSTRPIPLEEWLNRSK